MSIACISVNIGMWLERFLIIVPGLAQKSVFTFSWYTYAPSAVEITIIGGTFALVAMLMLLLSRVVPLIPLYDIKEGEILRTQIQVGRRTVPATFRGQSLVGELKGRNDQQRTVVSEMGTLKARIEMPWKLIVDSENPQPALFNLIEDPREQSSLAGRKRRS